MPRSKRNQNTITGADSPDKNIGKNVE